MLGIYEVCLKILDIIEKKKMQAESLKNNKVEYMNMKVPKLMQYNLRCSQAVILKQKIKKKNNKKENKIK